MPPTPNQFGNGTGPLQNEAAMGPLLKPGCGAFLLFFRVKMHRFYDDDEDDDDDDDKLT